MALIICTECGKKFSDRAAACPECGCPTSEIVNQANSVILGEDNLANNAFIDGRYDEAYQLYAQLYSKNPQNPRVLVRLGLVTAAKEHFCNGIPESAKELLKSGVALLKIESASHEYLVSELMQVVNDVKSVIDEAKAYAAKVAESDMKKLEPTRSSATVFADALFSPLVSANRNIYEDRRTQEKNIKILEEVKNEAQKTIATLESFGSFVLDIVASTLSEPIDRNDPLFIALGAFVFNATDANIYENLSCNGEEQDIAYGLCYGKEKVLLDFENNAAFMHINGKQYGWSFGLPKIPSGHLILSNYKVTYTATQEKQSFEKSLDNLLRIEVGGSGPYKTHIALIFSDNIKILITPPEKGKQAHYVEYLNSELKINIYSKKSTSIPVASASFSYEPQKPEARSDGKCNLSVFYRMNMGGAAVGVYTINNDPTKYMIRNGETKEHIVNNGKCTITLFYNFKKRPFELEVKDSALLTVVCNAFKIYIE